MADYQPAPQSATAELVERLAELHALASVNEVELRKLQQDARRLIRSDPAGAHTVLGGAASLQWNVDAVHDHYRIALQHLDTAIVRHNYSVSLANVEERTDAFAEATAAHGRAPDDRYLLGHAIERAVDAGRFNDAHQLCTRWNALADRPGGKHGMTATLEALRDAIRARAFTESGVQKVFSILSFVQSEERVRAVKSHLFRDPTEPHSFLYEQHVNAPRDGASRLNARFVDEVVSDVELMVDPRLSFTVMVVSAG